MIFQVEFFFSRNLLVKVCSRSLLHQADLARMNQLNVSIEQHNYSSPIQRSFYTICVRDNSIMDLNVNIYSIAKLFGLI